MRYLWLGSIAVVLLIGSPMGSPGSSADAPCGDRRNTPDPVGDWSGPPAAASPADLGAMDLTRFEVAPGQEGVNISVKLAKDPRAVRDWFFYIWVTFTGTDPRSGTPPTWTIQRSSTYDQIHSMYFEKRSSYPVVWNGTTFSFSLPWQDLEEALGNLTELELGRAHASTEGPYLAAPIGVPLEPPTDQWNDFVTEPEGNKGPLRCPPVDPSPTKQPAPTNDTPSVGIALSCFAVAGAAALGSRRRHGGQGA